MGTPQIAVESLKEIVHQGFDVVAVVTVPDKPAGRGQKINLSEVKKFALENSLTLLQPESLKDPEFIEQVKQLEPHLAVVVAFRKLPKELWSVPQWGTFNLHASLLPQYRGAAPINWAIINGETSSGVTTFFIDEKIDTGSILLQKEVSIDAEDDAGALHDKLMITGAGLVIETIKGIADQSLQAREQEKLLEEGISLKPAPKIFKEHCQINWNQPAQKVHNHIRGLSPFPAAFTTLELKDNPEGLFLKIFKTQIEPLSKAQNPGSWKSDGRNFLKVACQDACLSLLEVQAAGKKRMKIEDFLRGMRF